MTKKITMKPLLLAVVAAFGLAISSSAQSANAGTYNSVAYVATQHDSLYAINPANGSILWQRTFLDTTNPNDYLPGASSVAWTS